MNTLNISQKNFDKFLIAKHFLDSEAIKFNKETSLKILMRQYKLTRPDAIIIYNYWRRNWCSTNLNNKQNLI